LLARHSLQSTVNRLLFVLCRILKRLYTLCTLVMLFFDHNHEVFKTMLSLKTALERLSVLVCFLLHDHHFLLVSIHHFVGVDLGGHKVSLHPLNHMKVLTLVHHLKVSFLFYLFVLTLPVRYT
jgi:hypothetical protein